MSGEVETRSMPTTAMMIDALVAMRHEPGGVQADHFWQLVERFRADLVNQAVALLGNRPDAEDVAQDSLCRAFRCLSQLKDPQKLGSWLRTINRNNALQALRRRQKDPLPGGDELGHDAGLSYQVWQFLARYIAPVGVILVFLNAIGVIDAIGLFG